MVYLLETNICGDLNLFNSFTTTVGLSIRPAAFRINSIRDNTIRRLKF